MLIAQMDVAPAGIGLPDLEQRIRHAAAVLVQHMAVHDDTFAKRLALVLGGEIVVAGPHRLVTVERAGQFRQRVTHWNQRPRGRALDRTAVGRRERQGMCRVALDRIDECHRRLLGGSVFPLNYL
jgi:hypothetical protein